MAGAGEAVCAAAGRKVRPSFLKKRSKKLLPYGTEPKMQKFFVSFFQKRNTFS
jgi:hypothetical protein